MKLGGENVNKSAVHPFLVNAVSYQTADEVLPRARPSVQRQHQGFLRVVVGHESIHGFQDDA